MERAPAPLLETPRPTAGQRRHATVLFSDVSGSSEHAERLEAEEYAELLEQFRLYAREVIPRHGGSIARLQGDGVLALFGHVESQEDDGRRAAEAAFELHAKVGQLQAGTGADATPIKMHTGIHSGVVLMLDGDIERGRFDVVGEVPNTAARLCSLAAGGEILVSAETLGPQAHFFDVCTLGQLNIRGRSNALEVLRVDGRANIDRRIDAAARRGVVAFVGREAPMAQLLQAAHASGASGASGAGTAVTLALVGEPGIGKTRLLDEFQRQIDATTFCVLRGYCENYLGDEPFQPCLQAIRAALGWQASRSTDANEQAIAAALQLLGVHSAEETLHIARALLGLKAAALAPAPPPLRAAAVVDLVHLLAGTRRLVLVLDDWQWADDASRDALDLLRNGARPALVLLAARSSAVADAIPAGVEVLPLQPLQAAETDNAIAAWLPGVHPFVAQEISRRSGGSPLFIEELCHAAAAGSDLSAAPRATGLAWIDALIASRLLRLPQPQAELLRVASVVGNVVATALLERLAGHTGCFDAQGVEDFLVPAEQGGMLRFKHALTRDAVYATVDLSRRRALHRRVAETLEADPDHLDGFDRLESLSYHCDAAGMHAQAANYAEAAGDRALAAMALDRARKQYIRALDALDALPALPRPLQLRWCSIAQKLGQACAFDPLDIARGLVLFERAAQLARATSDDNAIARAEYWLAHVSYGKGLARRAVQHAERALAHALASDDQRLAAQIQATLGQALASAGRYTHALPVLDQAVAGKRQQRGPGGSTAIGSAYSLARLGYTYADLGRFGEADAAFVEALATIGESVHVVAASVLEVHAAALLWQGRWAEASAAAQRGIDVALRCRSRYLVAMGRALGACATWALHEDAASLQTLRESTAWIEQRGGAISTSLNYGWLVEATVSQGLWAEARQHAAGLFQRARAQDRQGLAMGCRALALLPAPTSRPANQAALARHYLAIADRAADARGSLREKAVNQWARAELSARAGQAAEARALAQEAAQAFEAMGMPWHLGRVRALG